MTSFQAIKATSHVLLAKAREPIEKRELAPSPEEPSPLSSGAPHPRNHALKTAQTGRRKTDSLVQHDSMLQRSWKTLVVWIARSYTGSERYRPCFA
jgi:hypothetical protein